MVAGVILHNAKSLQRWRRMIGQQTVDFDARPVKRKNCQLARFKSNRSLPTVLLYCLFFWQQERRKHRVSIDLSLSRDPTFVHTPAAKNVLSALTDDGGILSKYLSTNFRPRPRLPLDSNIAISLRMDASWDFSTPTGASVTRLQTSGSDDRHTQDCGIRATANENQIYRGSKSPYSHWLCWSSLQQCCTNAQPVINMESSTYCTRG